MLTAKECNLNQRKNLHHNILNSFEAQNCIPKLKTISCKYHTVNEKCDYKAVNHAKISRNIKGNFLKKNKFFLNEY